MESATAHKPLTVKELMASFGQVGSDDLIAQCESKVRDGHLALTALSFRHDSHGKLARQALPGTAAALNHLGKR